jgi:ferredoxin
MIFYFSGTGNSYQAARAVCGPGEEPVDLAKCLREGERSFRLCPDETLGFVCPVYYGGVPSVVLDFVRELSVSPAPDYCFCVLTCASSVSDAAGMLGEALGKRGIVLRAAYTVVMPENDSIHYTISPEEERDAILSDAEEQLKVIARSISEKRRLGLHIPPRGKQITRAACPYYEQDRATKNFSVDDSCVGCGKCVERCPVGAMAMEEGRPTWVKEKCALCMACIRCGAIQYGEATKGKKRYVNPILKCCH